MTFLGEQPEVDEERIGIYGTSYGGATVVWTAAIDQRAKCVVSVVGIGNGARWMSRVRRMDEWFDLLDRSKADRIQRVMTGKSEMVERGEILLPDRQSAALAAATAGQQPQRRDDHPGGVHRRHPGLQPGVGGRTGSRPARCCSSPATRTAWCRRKNRNSYTPTPANPRSWSC